jgi:trehalose/maltose hydrolase-like predicted phosphorylase
MFPWESALTGEETCPSWAATGLREIHINGDIAMAVWSMWRSLGGDNGGLFLNNTAWPLLSGIADFWMSKLALDNPGAPPGAPLSLLNVIPPDEYVDHVADSAFTNHGAIISLRYAAAVAQLMGEPPARYGPWADAAARIVRPFNASGPAGGWTPEYNGYREGSKIKQADVILLGFPLEAEWVPPAVRVNNLHLYANVTDPGGPAMTWGMFAVGYLELGPQYADAAATNFNRSFANAQPPFLVWTETPDGGTPNFLTGAGGFLQTALNGYPGLRVNDTALALQPQLPQGATALKLRGVAYLGQRLDVSYDGASVTVALQGGALGATAGGRRGACAACMRPAGEPVAWRSQEGRVLVGEREVARRPLAVVDARGVAHPLAVGAPVTLPLQAIAIVGS